jgi:methionine synthase reductase
MNDPVYVVYASQTGQAKTIAEQINDMLYDNGYAPKLFCISRHEKDFKFNEIPSYTPLIFICSTTGDGEVPETAVRCVNKIRRLNTDENKEFLSNLNYALLGLGDTNYTQFCNGPKTFHNRFQELGAKCFYGPFWADDGTGLEQTVEPFKEGLLDALEAHFSSLDKIDAEQQNHNSKTTDSDLDIEFNKLKIHDENIGSELTLPELTDNHIKIEYISENECDDVILSVQNEENMIKIFSHLYQHSSFGVFKASVLSNELMTQPSSEKDCYDIKFKLDAKFNQEGINANDVSDFTYEPGYAIDIICPNDSQEVDSLLNRLKISQTQRKQKISVKSLDESKKIGQTYIKLAQNCVSNIQTLFQFCIDIRTNSLKKNLLRMLAHYCKEDKDKLRLLQLSSKEGSDQYLELVKENHISLLDLLNVFKSCEPSVDHLIQMLPTLNPRPYSLCSCQSDEENFDKLEIVFNLVKFKSDPNSSRTYDRNGLGTGYLSKLRSNESIYFLKRKFQTFTFPLDSQSKPVIMIGPGTGIAPMISFLRHVKNEKDKNNKHANLLWLFYGCRDPQKDFLFKNEIISSLNQYLTKFFVTFSRFSFDPNDKSIEEVELKNFIQQHHQPSNSKYVQESIELNSKEIIQLINEQDAFVYVCGDAKNMSKDVLNCFVECLKKELNLSQEDASQYLTEMMKNKRYKQDIWA